MATSANRHRARSRRSAAPVLLPTFVVGIGAVVLAVLALNHFQSGLADAGAVLLVVLLAGLLLAAILRLVGQEGDDPRDGAGGDAP